MRSDAKALKEQLRVQLAGNHSVGRGNLGLDSPAKQNMDDGVQSKELGGD